VKSVNFIKEYKEELIKKLQKDVQKQKADERGGFEKRIILKGER
jgi:hypothetical protein